MLNHFARCIQIAANMAGGLDIVGFDMMKGLRPEVQPSLAGPGCGWLRHHNGFQDRSLPSRNAAKDSMISPLAEHIICVRFSRSRA